MHPGDFVGGAPAGVGDSMAPASAVRSGCRAPGSAMRETITTELLRRLQQAPPTARPRHLRHQGAPPGAARPPDRQALVPPRAWTRALVHAGEHRPDPVAGTRPRRSAEAVGRLCQRRRSARRETRRASADVHRLPGPSLCALAERPSTDGRRDRRAAEGLVCAQPGSAEPPGAQCLAHREVAERSAQERAHPGHREPGSGRAARAAQPRRGLGTSARAPADAGQGAGRGQDRAPALSRGGRRGPAGRRARGAR